MAEDIFVRAATQLAGAFAADNGRLSFGAGITTALVQNVNATYQQNITRLYEIGLQNNAVANVYYVGGRTQGTMAIARVIGPSVVISSYYRKFGDVCQAKTNTMDLIFNPLDCDRGFAVYSCKYCVIVAIGISVAAQDMVVNENSQLMFSALEFEDEESINSVPGAAAGAGAGAGAGAPDLEVEPPIDFDVVTDAVGPPVVVDPDLIIPV